MAFAPIFSSLWILTLALAGALLIGLLFLRDRPSLLRRSALRLAALRALLLALLLVFLLNPYFVRETADQRAYEVVVLTDVSGSMLTADAGDQQNVSRLETAQELLFGNDANGLFARLADEHTLRLFSFAEDTAPVAMRDSRLEYRSGGTAAGDSLARAPELVLPNHRLGAVLLLSDGISNTGRPLMDAVQSLKSAGVPVHVVGIGSQREAGDRFVRLRDRSVPAERDGLARLEVDLGHTFERAQSVTVEVYDGTERLLAEEVEVPAGAPVTRTLEIPAPDARQSSVSVRLRSEEPDANAANDVDFATVTLRDPPQITVLYLSAAPAWEARLLRRLYADSETVELRRILQIAPDHVLADSTSDTFIVPEDPQLPATAEAWFDYDAIVLDAGAWPLLSAEARTGLEAFVANRGGGLIFVGDAEALKGAEGGLPPLFPARGLRTHQTQESARLIDISPVPVFVDQSSGPLFNPPFPVIPDASVFRATADPKRGARIIAETSEERIPVLTVQAFGAGRSGYFGMDRTWRWRLGSERGLDQHSELWNGLISWLSLGGKPRVSTDVDAKVVAADQPADLSVRVLGADYLPSAEAMARVAVTRENETKEMHQLTPSLTEPGRYQLDLSDLPPGFYTADYLVQMPEGEVVETTARFTVVPSRTEQGDTVFREALLRDVARVTGGRYWTPREAENIERLPLSDDVPLLEEPVYWARAWPVLLFALLLSGSEWYLRRREGLN